MTTTPQTGASPSTRALVAAGALFVDDSDRAMLVRPTYKDYWEIPGGYVMPGESPYDACGREVFEELGIRPPIGTLLSVDWAPHPIEGDKVLFVFDGGVLDREILDQIQFQDGEIDQCRFVPADEIPTLTIDRLARRIVESLRARHAGATAYLEAGRSSTPRR